MTKDEAMHPSRRTIRVGSADIHVTEWGAGLPVLMLHGNPDSGIMWDGIAERLATHYRCIARICRASAIRKCRPASSGRSTAWLNSSSNF